MIISTQRTDNLSKASRPAASGFSLLEVMTAAALSTMILGGVLSAFAFIGKSGFRASSYSEIEAQIRRGLDTFANDARMAQDIVWNNSQSITLSLPTAGNGAELVTYAYDPANSGETAQCFYRMPGEAAAGNPRRILITTVDPSFSFSRYKLEQNGITDNSAVNDLETKLVQINLKVSRIGQTTGASTQTSRSARYLLRNKRVSN